MNKNQILAKINEIQDPDIGIGLADLGLVYNIKIADAKIFL